MTAVISRERAARTGLTAAAGVLMLAVAFVMMVVAAPGHGHVQVRPAKPSVVRLTTDVSHAAAFTGRTTFAGRAAPGPNAARP
jgi:hypothetical protein